MKRKFLNIISCFLALFIFVGSFVFCVPSRVLADSVNFEFYPSSASVSDYQSYFENLLSNPSYSDLSGDIYLSLFLSRFGGADYLIILNPSHSVSSDYDIWTGDYCQGHVSSASGMSSINLSLSSSSNSSSSHMIYALYRKVGSSSYFDVCTGYFDSNFVIYSRTFHNYSLFAWSNSYSPSYEYVTGLHFSYDVDDFYTWIINNNKLSELPSYIVQSKLKSFLDFYRSFGSSNSYFVSMIGDWFSQMNIVSQSLSNINILKSSIDKLYQEYLNYRSGTHAYWPGATKIQERNDIDTITDNNNTLLITADPSDSVEISILRDILRGVIAISNNIIDGVSRLVSKLEQLNFTVNVSNDGGISNIDFTPVLNKMDDIIDKLEADTVSVEIDQTTKDDTEVFFDDWNLEFSNALNNKFPVASQLRTFFTGFFERCGIDADSDGEVYQYYNPGVLTASRVSRSAGTASEAAIVSDFLGKFDNSDPTFLDDASFQGVPDLSVSVGGHSVSIIDFRVYAKYRDKIHFIISFVIWTLYLLHLYKALPSIIGQVADVAVKTSDL